MKYSHTIINGSFELVKVSKDGLTGKFIDSTSYYKIEQTFLIAYMTKGTK